MPINSVVTAASTSIFDEAAAIQPPKVNTIVTAAHAVPSRPQLRSISGLARQDNCVQQIQGSDSRETTSQPSTCLNASMMNSHGSIAKEPRPTTVSGLGDVRANPRKAAVPGRTYACIRNGSARLAGGNPEFANCRTDRRVRCCRYKSVSVRDRLKSRLGHQRYRSSPHYISGGFSQRDRGCRRSHRSSLVRRGQPDRRAMVRRGHAVYRASSYTETCGAIGPAASS